MKLVKVNDNSGRIASNSGQLTMAEGELLIDLCFIYGRFVLLTTRV